MEIGEPAGLNYTWTTSSWDINNVGKLEMVIGKSLEIVWERIEMCVRKQAGGVRDCLEMREILMREMGQ